MLPASQPYFCLWEEEGCDLPSILDLGPQVQAGWRSWFRLDALGGTAFSSCVSVCYAHGCAEPLLLRVPGSGFAA